MPRKFEDWLIWILASFVFGILMAGCVTPEGFSVDETCEVKPGDTYRYECTDGTYRCTDTKGATKYVDCRLPGGTYCVSECN
jgi:hypothetical protein